ncbi:MAG: dipeptide epimerase [Gammaproteobacteria bacterium]|nr:dipeptide epimerase [Gammaproteobacteria bacterium]
MDIAFRTIRLRKRVALAISRGVSGDSDNLFVSVTCGGVTGWGEMAPGVSQGAATAQAGEAALRAFCAELDADGAAPPPLPGIMQIHDRALRRRVPACALAALDMALWDARARRARMPLYQLLGIARPRAPTSITLGISPPELVRERIPQLLGGGNGIRALKVKLGSKHGIAADQAMFAAVLESVRCLGRAVSLRVDANGGWDVHEAQVMMKWLAGHGVEFVEQPLEAGREADLPALYKNRPLPIFVDESCRFADDIPVWAESVDGVNLKLMKCGGITGALRIIAVAGALRLKIMAGCMSESSLSISAAAALGGALDYIDLDSQLNLAPDPCRGAQLVDGIVTPPESPGHGAQIIVADPRHAE